MQSRFFDGDLLQTSKTWRFHLFLPRDKKEDSYFSITERMMGFYFV